jgi:anti-sigma regulatory factor (Ser/Thr protein kinase)
MAASDELVVRSDLTAVRRTRHFARRVAERLGAEADTLELLVSELVTNAMLHGAPPIRVRIEMIRDRVHVAVTDASPRLPLAERPRSEDLTGRGLAIVEALSEAWGALLRPDGGKVVWADVAPSPSHRQPQPSWRSNAGGWTR